MMRAIAQGGEPLDELLWRSIGRSAVEPVLLANPGLAELGAFLPEGTIVLIPETAAAAPAAAPLLELWD